MKAHAPGWRETVLLKRLKNFDNLKYMRRRPLVDGETPREPFTVDGFIECLVRFIVVDDQVSYLLLPRLSDFNLMLFFSHLVLSVVRSSESFYSISALI